MWQHYGELTEEELSAVCQRLPRGKAPGDDGLPYEFYVAFWQQLAPRLLAVLNAAFHSTSAAVLPLSMRSGRITLLYKGKAQRAAGCAAAGVAGGPRRRH